jgi:capsid protein
VVAFFKWFLKKEKTPTVSVNDLPMIKAYNGQSNRQDFIYDGDKFPGGFGPVNVVSEDYYALRERSEELFKTNLYAAGLIRRLITNEINTGLAPECCPDEDILNLPEDSLSDWTETTENRFNIWAKNPELCDYKQQDTFGALQRMIRTEALIGGDVLIVLRYSKKHSLPQLQVIKGAMVQSPWGGDTNKIPKNHVLYNGVELNSKRRVVAYWVRQSNGDFQRILAKGKKTGRRVAWLLYGVDRRVENYRGKPLLSIVLQSLKEIDRYRDSTQRKAVINSILAMFIKKTEDKMGTLPIQGGAVRRDVAEITDSDGKTRNFNIASQLPGMIIEELQTGEEPVLKGGEGTDINFAEFEEAIIQSVAWANEVPPEILRLAFSNNYSASQAAINEFKIYLNKIWSEFGECLCTPVYIEWLISETLIGKNDKTQILESWRDPEQYDIFGAWVAVDWYGSIKPSTDMLKQAKGSKMLIDEGWSTNARESRITTGTKFSKNIKRIKRENMLKAEAMRPLLELQKEFSMKEETQELTDEGVDTNTNNLLILEGKKDA